MKFIIYLMLLVSITFVQAQLTDDFSDGELLMNPTWQGHLDSFEVATQVLHLNAPPSASKSFVVTPSIGAVSGFWEFELRMDFNPSSSNKAKVYLMSDTNDLTAPLNGYFVMLGNTEDEVSLYKQSATSLTEIIDGQDGVLGQSSNLVKVKVERDAFGNFTLEIDTSQALNSYILQGNVYDDSFLASNYFGLLCEYTAARCDKFWMDNIIVNTQVYLDQEAPILLNHQVGSLQSIAMFFNEPLDSNFSLLSSSYILLGTTTPAVIDFQEQNITLHFNAYFQQNLTYQLQVFAMDLTGNVLDTMFQFSISDNYAFQSIIINEIYADESPSYGMPAYEFLELRNTTIDTIYLIDWRIADATDTVTIPNDTIYPLSFLILCKTTAAPSYTAFGRTKGVPNFPSLNNTGDALILFNKYDFIIDSLTYTSSWYMGETDDLGHFKKEGGFSLERINTSMVCSDKYNWFPSIALAGASPGATNSIENHNFPFLVILVEDVVIDNDTTLIIYLNHEAPFLNEQYISITNLGIEQAFSFDHKELFIMLDQPLITGNSYTIAFSNVLDCRGNPVSEFSYEFYSFELPNKEDIVINEILFNPRTGGSDYLELYNKSDKLINLEGFQILEYDPLDPSAVLDKVVLADCIIKAHDYIVLTEDSDAVLSNYIVAFPNNLYELALPNFPDNEGLITLNFPDGSLIDSLAYHKNWHLELLDVQDGAALERIESLGETNNPDNWQTAAKTYGYGTPTSKNSQSFEGDLESKTSVEPEVFTPNEDGYKDFCLIKYLDAAVGEIATITIYNAVGQEIKLIAQNHSLGIENVWKWNGTNNNFEKADVGIYIVLFEVFDLEGKKKRIKEKVVLGTPLN